jgi:hypothetical protein
MSHRISLGLFITATLSVAACSDGVLAPGGTRGGRSISSPDGRPLASSSSTIGDTTVTSFTLNGNGGTWVIVAGEHKLTFGNGLSSICDPATSSYGPGEWDQPCTPATAPITVTAKVWTNGAGRAQVDFSPALRFVPGQQVTLYMYDKQVADGLLDARMYYCPTPGGPCLNEAMSDPSVATHKNTAGFLYRRVKHFSGYNVAAREEGDTTSMEE